MQDIYCAAVVAKHRDHPQQAASIGGGFIFAESEEAAETIAHDSARERFPEALYSEVHVRVFRANAVEKSIMTDILFGDLALG